MKKILTAVLLAGVMTVSAVTAGCGNKDDKNEKSEKSVKDITHSISDTLEQAEKAMKGELEFAYDANMNVSFGSALNDLIGIEVKPVDISTKTKQKGKKTSADMSVKYDSQDLVNVKTVYDHQGESVYLQVPELSDAYLVTTNQDIEALVNSEMDEMTQDGSSPLALSQDLLNNIKNIDFDKLEDDIESYIDLIEEKAPEAKDGEKISGEIDGHKYTYDTKTYEIKGEDLKNVAVAVVEKAKTDSFIKDIVVSVGVTEEQYDSALDSALTEMNEISDEEAQEKICDFEAYYDGDDLRGYKLIAEGIEYNVLTIEDDDVYAVDCVLKENDSTIVDFKGSAVEKDDKINGEYNVVMNVDGSDITMKITLSDVAENDDVFSGTIKYDYMMDIDGVQVSPSVVLTSNSTKDKLDISMAVSESDKDYLTITMTCEKTDASDITLPTGTLYNMTNETDLQNYQEGCDINGFMSNIQTVLGSDLINAFSSIISSANEVDDYDYDENYEYEDYDFSDEYILEDMSDVA